MNRRESKRRPPILDRVESFGFKVFEEPNYDLNIIGVRKIHNRQDNEFDDTIHVCYRMLDIWVHEWGPATTDPGSYWLTKPDYKPCAIYYHPQQARGAYQIGFHRGNSSHEGLKQVRPVKFWRDSNKDEHADYAGFVHKDLIGLNIHRSSTRPEGSHYVNKWSAGCQVFKYARDLARLIELCKLQIEHHPNWAKEFTYTLIPEE